MSDTPDMSLTELVRSRVALAAVVSAASTGATLTATHLPARAAETHAITGTIEWQSTDNTSTGCDNGPGSRQVTVTDENFRPLAHGHLTGKPVRLGRTGQCLSPFRITAVPDAPTYTLQIGTDLLHSAAFDRTYLQNEDWMLPFVAIPTGGTSVVLAP